MMKMDTHRALPTGNSSRSIAIRRPTHSMKRAAPSATGSPTYEDYDSEDSTSSHNYDLCTWRMYTRITEARQRNPLSARYLQDVTADAQQQPIQAPVLTAGSTSKRVVFDEQQQGAEDDAIFDFEL